AATDWETAASARPLLTGSALSSLEAPATATGDSSFGNITPVMLQAWSSQARHDAMAIAKAPSEMTLVGNGEKAVTVRHFVDDTSLSSTLSTVRKLQGVSKNFGWIVPDEEVLVFPNESALSTYASDATNSGETSLGVCGRVWQEQLLMIPQLSTSTTIAGTPERIFVRGRRREVVPATKWRVVKVDASAGMLGRMHAKALVDALDEDGGQVPVWMQLGMMSLGGDAATDDKKAPTVELLQAGAANKLLSPDRFNIEMLSGTKSDLADAEALSLMTYFYEDFGAGDVMQTIERIASGQSANEALTATTGMDENEFFKAWYNALSGSRSTRPAPARRTTVRRTKEPQITTYAAGGARVTRF
ncbi:MAG: hypothetical protein ABI210_08430, partial [Abditibacteriaceae bacterium]